jgi:hypothetical protein
MNLRDRLEHHIKISDIHSARLCAGLQKISNYLPLKPLFIEFMDDDQVAILDMISTRFARLQDLIGVRIFPAILGLLQEDIGSYRDNLNRLEKLKILHDASWWAEIRSLPNNIIHEYPDEYEYLSECLNKLMKESAALLSFWSNLKEKIQELKL